MQPESIEVEPFTVAGLSVRTSNSQEKDQNTATIGGLWEQFFAEDIPGKVSGGEEGTPFYGVYFDFESDEQGPYSVLAGVEVTEETEGFDAVFIPGGRYLVFKAEGAVPQIVFETWGQIWNFFENNSEYQRAFGADFEIYPSETEVAIYIGVK